MNENYNNGVPNYYSTTNSASLSLNDEIARGMNIYFKAKENSRYLTEDNKILVSNAEYYISAVPNNHPVKQIINNEINSYYARAK